MEAVYMDALYIWTPLYMDALIYGRRGTKKSESTYTAERLSISELTRRRRREKNTGGPCGERMPGAGGERPGLAITRDLAR